jgi:hypothetical protein
MLPYAHGVFVGADPRIHHKAKINRKGYITHERNEKVQKQGTQPPMCLYRLCINQVEDARAL